MHTIGGMHRTYFNAALVAAALLRHKGLRTALPNKRLSCTLLPYKPARRGGILPPRTGTTPKRLPSAATPCCLCMPTLISPMGVSCRHGAQASYASRRPRWHGGCLPGWAGGRTLGGMEHQRQVDGYLLAAMQRHVRRGLRDVWWRALGAIRGVAGCGRTMARAAPETFFREPSRLAP